MYVNVSTKMHTLQLEEQNCDMMVCAQN